MIACSATIPVDGDDSLHLRPIQALVETASNFRAKLTVSRGKRFADAKSIFEVMMLATERGPLALQADGPDAEQAVQALVDRMKAELSKR